MKDYYGLSWAEYCFKKLTDEGYPEQISGKLISQIYHDRKENSFWENEIDKMNKKWDERVASIRKIFESIFENINYSFYNVDRVIDTLAVKQITQKDLR